VALKSPGGWIDSRRLASSILKQAADSLSAGAPQLSYWR
jgi:hypothetical protein